MINLRKEGDKLPKTYNKYIDSMTDEHKDLITRILEANNESIAKSGLIQSKFDPKKPDESSFYKKLVQIVTTKDSTAKQAEKTIDKLLKDMKDTKEETVAQPDINDIIKKINTLTLDIGSNQHVTNDKYLKALGMLSNMLVDVKESIEKRDKKILGLAHTLESSLIKNRILDILNKE
jgi:hypothetical protein